MTEGPPAILFRKCRDAPPNEFGACVKGARAAFSPQVLEVRIGGLEWIEIGRGGSKVSQGCASSLGRFSDPGDLMRLKVIHEDDVARLQNRSEHISSVGTESGTIHQAVDDQGRCKAIDAQSSSQGERLPVAVRNFGGQALADRRSTVNAGHLQRQVIFVVTAVSSTDTRRRCDSLACRAFRRARAAATSGRSCSVACSTFLKYVIS
jgi:hypothetical protein